MTIRDINIQLLNHAASYINKRGIKNLNLTLVAPSDKRCKCQIEIKDLETKQKFGLLANKKSDIEGLLPKLIDTLLTMRDKIIIKLD